MDTTIVIFIFFMLLWFCMNYIYIYPSMVQFGNRQAVAHENPIYDELKTLHKRLDDIESALKDNSNI
jgi:hypothetical protein